MKNDDEINNNNISNNKNTANKPNEFLRQPRRNNLMNPNFIDDMSGSSLNNHPSLEKKDDFNESNDINKSGALNNNDNQDFQKDGIASNNGNNQQSEKKLVNNNNDSTENNNSSKNIESNNNKIVNNNGSQKSNIDSGLNNKNNDIVAGINNNNFVNKGKNSNNIVPNKNNNLPKAIDNNDIKVVSFDGGNNQDLDNLNDNQDQKDNQGDRYNNLNQKQDNDNSVINNEGNYPPSGAESNSENVPAIGYNGQKANRGSSEANNGKKQPNNPKNSPFSNTISDKLNKFRKNNKKNNSSENQDDKNAKNTQDKKGQSTSNKIANTINNAKKISSGKSAQNANGAQENSQNALQQGAQKLEETGEKLKETAEKAKKAKKLLKILASIPKIVWIILLVILGIIVIALLIFIIVQIIINVESKDSEAITKISVDYCESMIVRWKEIEIENGVEKEVEKEEEVTSNEYLAYDMAKKYYHEVNNEEVLKALAIIHRTNLYFIANHTNSNCEFDLEEPYFDARDDEGNQEIIDAINKTDNKVFTTTKDFLNELKIDDNFTYKSEVEAYHGPAYILSQDNMYYFKDWVDENIDPKYKVNGYDQYRSFSPWAAWYLIENKDEDYHTILYHFYDPNATVGDIYEVDKKNDLLSYGGGCGDISLTTTSLTREEFVEKVKAYGQNSSNRTAKAMADAAEKIYDISVANNFNPELVVERAMNEQSAATNNYWGIGYYNNGGGGKPSYRTIDEGILSFININKNYGVDTLFDVYYVKHYAYLGDNWYKTTGSKTDAGHGGCYYLKSVEPYLSSERYAEVEKACSEGNEIPTIDEDHRAYSRYQIQRMLDFQRDIFGIDPEQCESEMDSEWTEETGDLNSLGKRVADYAVATYDTWSYSQGLRMQHGYVDCSSLITRAYAHFNFSVAGGNGNSSAIYSWCSNNHKMVTGSPLRPGDIILYANGTHHNSSHAGGVGHVALFVGNGKIIAAHTAKTSQEKQVSVTNYSGNGTYVCRPAE